MYLQAEPEPARIQEAAEFLAAAHTRSLAPRIVDLGLLLELFGSCRDVRRSFWLEAIKVKHEGKNCLRNPDKLSS